MFTGIVEKIGKVESVTARAGGKVANISVGEELRDPRVGESIAVNGVCLTVIDFGRGAFDVEMSPETLKRSNLRELKKGDYVNIERALKVGGRLGGHFVNGHTDGVGVLGLSRKMGDSVVFEIKADDTIMRYIVFKGSVALNGISLTVSGVKKNLFEVTVLPYTMEQTNLKFAKQGDRLNIEVDIIGKYVERFVKKDKDTKFLELLGNSGFLKED